MSVEWLRQLMEEMLHPQKLIARGLGGMVEGLAGWRLDHEARHGSQVLAVALESGGVFVLFRGHVHLVSADEAGWLLPGRMLSADERRALFGPGSGVRPPQQLTGQGARFRIAPVDRLGITVLRMESDDGSSRSWSISSRSIAEDLCARLNGLAAPRP